MRSLKLFAFILFAGLLLTGSLAAQEPVRIQLSLTIDVSASISPQEFDLQKDSYADFIESADFPQDGSIALNVVFFASIAMEMIPWTRITDPATATSFANDLRNLDRAGLGGSTAVGDAIHASSQTFINNGFTTGRKIIDVSGDGVANTGRDTAAARDAALLIVDTINGLAIGDEQLFGWYQNNVIGGIGSFAAQARDFGEFRAAVNLKLQGEICPPLELRVTPQILVAGRPIRYEADACPGDKVFFLKTPTGTGVGPFIPKLNLNLDILPPIRFRGFSIADQNELAVLIETVPSGITSGKELWIQAVLVRSGGGVQVGVKSNVVKVTFQ